MRLRLQLLLHHIGGVLGTHPDGVSAATPKQGGTLIFGVDAEEKGFSPTQGTFDEVGILYARTVFDPLLILDADSTPKPYLAESVIPNSDYTVWTITMRPFLEFHNGTPCDATAVAANFNAHKASALTGPALTTVADVTVTSPLVVTVTMKSPWVPFDYYLTGGIGGQFAFIAEPTWLASRQPDQPHRHRAVRLPGVDARTTTSPRPRTPTTGGPATPTSTPSPTSPSSIRTSCSASLDSGVVDIMHTDVPEVITTIRGDTSLGYIDDSKNVAGEPDMGFILLNLSKAPFNNLKLRQAMAYAVSSAQYVAVIDKGVNATSNGPFTPGLPTTWPTTATPPTTWPRPPAWSNRYSRRPAIPWPSASTTPPTPRPPVSPSTSSRCCRTWGCR